MTTRYSKKQKGPNRDKILARFNYNRMPENTTRNDPRQDHVFVYELQLLLSRVLTVLFQNLSYKKSSDQSVTCLVASNMVIYWCFLPYEVVAVLSNPTPNPILYNIT